ncbi:MAG: hypothetical protein HRT47_01900 [Candidatus Caenarcaniphilales bacterium]|nr:hypothetical protein [Candidatus Caenarcaniphilales bacterium]
MLNKALLIFSILIFSVNNTQALTLPNDTMVKIAYLSPLTAKYGDTLDIYVRRSVFQKDENDRRVLVIPAGTKGQLTITKIGGLNNDIVMDSKGFLILGEKKVCLKHYKDKRKALRKIYKVGKYAGIGSVFGVASTIAGSAIKRKTNKLNLPKKMFTTQNLIFSI